MDLQLRILDGMSWRGEPVRGHRSQSLLRALVDAWPHPEEPGALIAAVWPESRPKTPAKALQVLVSRTRSATAAHVIASTAAGYRLGLDAAQVDALRHRRLITDAESALRSGDTITAASFARAALDLAPSERGHRVELLANPQAPAADLELFARAHPNDEEIAAAWLRRVAADNGPAQALGQYEEIRRRLVDDLGAGPGPAVRAVHRELLAADQPVRAGLRYASTSLVGREDDLAQIQGLLSASRLVSIVGTGGLGKTRLAHEIALANAAPAVYVVELASIDSGDDVAAAVARAVDTREGVTTRDQRHTHLSAQIAEQLAHAPSLLVIDNCEHVIDAAADLVAFLLSQVSDLRILTTSRTPLHLTAERVHPLGQLLNTDAAELFRERAAAVRPEAHLDPGDVSRLVAHLDGLPLAIELAAARMRTMSLPQILNHLGDRFALLSAGERGAPRRHRTLEAVIDWSWHLLDPLAQQALAMLTAWPDGVTADGAVSMLGDGAGEVIASLLDQSLLEISDPRGQVRYRMLETVREYGQRELHRSGRTQLARRAVADWAVEFAREHGPNLFAAAQLDAVDAFRPEETTLTEVLRSALAAGEVEVAIPVLAALAPYWLIRGEHLRIVAMVEPVDEFLGRACVPASLAEEARAGVSVLQLTWAFFPQSRPFDHGRDLVARLGAGAGNALVRISATLSTLPGRATSRAPHHLRDLVNDPDRLVSLLAAPFLAMMLENAGQVPEAIAVLETAIARARPGDPPWLETNQRAIVGQFHGQLGDMELARTQVERALPVLARLGATDDVIQCRALIAAADLARGELAQARVELETLAGLQQHGRGLGGWSAVVLGRAEIAYLEGDIRTGRELVEESIHPRHLMRRSEFADPDGLDPWSLVTGGAALALQARHDPPADPGFWRDLLNRTERASHPQRREYDFPVLGTVCFGLAYAGAGMGWMGQAQAARLLVIADQLGYNRFLPSLAWAGAADELEPGRIDQARADVAGRRGRELIPALHHELGIIRGAGNS